MHDNTEDNAKRPAAFSKFWKQWGRKKGASEEGSEQPGLGRAPRANQGGSQKDPRNSGKKRAKDRAADSRRVAREQEARRVRERVLEERRRERAAGIERPKRDREQVSQAIKEQRHLHEERKREEQRLLEEQRRLQEQAKRNRRGSFARRNPREPHALPTERLDPAEQARLLEEAGYEHSWDLTAINGGEGTHVSAAPDDAVRSVTSESVAADDEGSDQSRVSATSEDAGLGQARESAPAGQTATEDATNAEATAIDGGKKGRASATLSETTVTRVPIERKVIVVRAPRGWPRIVLAAVEVAVISWAVLVAVSLVSFLATAQNPWLLEADWNTAISVGTDIWALSYGAPIVVGGAFLRMIPLGLTVLHILLARAGLKRARAASWQGSALFIPAYVLTVIVLLLVTSLHAHKGWRILGALLVATLAWVWSLRSWEWDPQWFTKSGPYLRGVRDGLIATSSLAILGLVVAVVGTIAGWSRALGIQELLNASIFDLVVVWIAQLLYIPNIAAWGASWITGPGFYTASDAIITPSRADITAIPAIPLMGAFPQTEIGMWVVLIPIAVGIALGAYMVWKNREVALVDHLLHAGFAATTMLVVVMVWMWLSTGSIGPARMSILGPRWIYATIFGTLEIGFTAAVIYALAHPLLLAKYVAGGKFAKASTLSAVETASQKIQSRRGKLSTDAIDEGGAEISPGSEGTAEDSLDSEGGADDLPNPEGGAEDSSESEGGADNPPSPESGADVESNPETGADSPPNPEGNADGSESPEAATDDQAEPEADGEDPAKRAEQEPPKSEDATLADPTRETHVDAAGVESETDTGKAPSSKETQDDEPRR